MFNDTFCVFAPFIYELYRLFTSRFPVFIARKTVREDLVNDAVSVPFRHFRPSVHCDLIRRKSSFGRFFYYSTDRELSVACKVYHAAYAAEMFIIITVVKRMDPVIQFGFYPEAVPDEAAYLRRLKLYGILSLFSFRDPDPLVPV